MYDSYFNRKAITIWDVISEQTVLVYEAGDCRSCIEEISKSHFWLAAENSFFNHMSVDESTALWDAIIKSADKLLVSLHITQKDDFDFVYYLPIKEAKSVESYLNSLKERNFRFSQRELNGIEIHEVQFGNQMFSWTFFEDVWAASFTPFLIEDVIRTYKSDRKRTFATAISGVQQFPKVKSDAGDFYINLKGISQWLSTFFQAQNSIVHSGRAALLDVKSNSNSIILNGFSAAEENANDELLSYFYNQSPVPFALKQNIPNRAIAVLSFGITDGAQLFRRLPIGKNKSFQDSIQLLTSINPEELFAGISKELSLCFFEDRGDRISKVLILTASNATDWLGVFERMAQATEKEDTVYFEQYASYEIREVDLKNLPEKLFKPLVTGFERTYFTHSGNVLILAEKVEDLRRYLDDIEREEVWGRSVKFNRYLESTLLESNLSIYINVPQALGFLQMKLSSKWSPALNKSIQAGLNSVDFTAIQFSALNNNFYTNVSFVLNDRKAEVTETSNRIQANMDHRIVRGPFVIKNHVTKRSELLVQDSAYALHYFSLDGKRIWRKSLGAEITDRVHQVDYFSNNKLQLLLLTNGKLDIIDRLGNPVSPFPVSAPNQPIEYISLIDYDNSKRYRYLLAERTGKLWLLDKEGKLLEGWKPRTVDGPLLVSARHHRIRGKDFIVAFRKDGTVHVFNRRGEDIKGFPIHLESKPAGEYFLEHGNTVASTNFVVVTKDGIKIKFSIEGKLISREPLVKTAVDDEFGLIAERSGKSYIIYKQNARQFELLSEQGTRILLNDFVGTNRVQVQYYDFGSGNVYYVLADQTQDLAYIYDSSGSLLTPVPLEAESITLFIDENMVYSAAAFGTQLQLQPVSK